MSPGSIFASGTRLPWPYSAYELCGRSTPTRRYAQRTRPEQSKPVDGDSPPQRYGTPTSSRANRAARSALVGGGGSRLDSGPGLISLELAVAGSTPAAARAATRQNRGTRLRRVVGIGAGRTVRARAPRRCARRTWSVRDSPHGSHEGGYVYPSTGPKGQRVEEVTKHGRVARELVEA